MYVNDFIGSSAFLAAEEIGYLPKGEGWKYVLDGRDVYKRQLIKRVKEAGVKVVMNTEVTPEYVEKFNPDALFVAIGSNELCPPIKGMELPNVVMAIDAELHPEKLGKRIAIMGGGLVGAEAAVSFHHEGKECSIIEMKSAVAEEVNSFYRGGLMPEIEKAAKCYVNTKVKEIVKEGVLLSLIHI